MQWSAVHRGAHAVQTRVVSVDLGQSQGVSTLIDAVDDLDVGLAVLAAGFGSNENFADSDSQIERDMIAVNVTAVAQLAQFFARRMSARGRGGLMLFGSILGWQGVPGQANYSATKAYVQALAEALHSELKPAGVDVLSVAPRAGGHRVRQPRRGRSSSRSPSPRFPARSDQPSSAAR